MHTVGHLDELAVAIDVLDIAPSVDGNVKYFDVHPSISH
jgi:hypothetical protein